MSLPHESTSSSSVDSVMLFVVRSHHYELGDPLLVEVFENQLLQDGHWTVVTFSDKSQRNVLDADYKTLLPAVGYTW